MMAPAGRNADVGRAMAREAKEKLWLFGLPLRHPNCQSVSVRRRFAQYDECDDDASIALRAALAK